MIKVSHLSQKIIFITQQQQDKGLDSEMKKKIVTDASSKKIQEHKRNGWEDFQQHQSPGKMKLKSQ